MNAVSHYLEAYPELSATLPGQDLPWLARLRKDALACFAANGFPTPREEEWKYTNIAPIEKHRFSPTPAAAPGLVDAEAIARYRLADAWSLVFVDGMYAPGLSITAGMPENLVAMSMAEALARHPSKVEALLQKAVAEETHGFIGFAMAYFRDGAFILIDQGLAIARPLQIVHFSTRVEGCAVTRNLIALERNAEATVIETYAGVAGTAYLTAAVSEISLGENAGLTHCKLQVESSQAYHFGGIYAIQAPSSRYTQHHAAFGGLLSRTEIHTQLGRAAECELNGLFLGTERRHLDTHTLIQHKAPHGTSRETYRGIAGDKARGVFAGKIVVHPEAQKTDAEMNNRNLLLSGDAEIDSKPQLEIHADDVKCAHGVTVGQLDANAVFYLASRGVDEASARNMLTFAFANEMVEKIRLESLRNLVREELLSGLPGAGVRRDWL